MENSLIISALFIILGWLFGLLSPAIIDAIRDRRKINDVKKVIIAELQELQYRLLLEVFLIEKDYGNLNRTFFEWAQTILAEYKGINSIDTLLKTTSTLLKLTNDEVTDLAKQSNEVNKPGSGLLFRRHFISSVEIYLPLIAKLDPILLGRLLEIKTRIGFINETSEESYYYFKLSFQNGISNENFEIARTNMIGSYKNYARQARDIIEIIKKVFLELN